MAIRRAMSKGWSMRPKKKARPANAAPRPPGMEQMGPALYAQIRQAVKELTAASASGR